MPKLRSHEEFLKDFKEKQPNLFNSLEIMSKYEKNNKSIFIKNDFGTCKVFPNHLLSGHYPSIQTAIDKHNYFLNFLQFKQPKVFKALTILDKYKRDGISLRVQDKYGICLITPSNLLQGHLPAISTAINKTEYFINQAKEIHGDLYDYSLVNYKNNSTKVKIISKYQTFEQEPVNHLTGQGCNILGNQSNYKYKTYINKGLQNKYCKNFKCYIIQCWNENETFYKIGKTFVTLKQRFPRNKSMPYSYKILHEIIFAKTFEKGYKCCELEHKLYFENKIFKYTPLIKFGGSKTECFSNIDNLIF